MTLLPETRRTPDDSGFHIWGLPATDAAVHDFRRHFTQWTADTLTTCDERRCDIVLAVYETVAHAAEHACVNNAAGGPMEVHAHYRPRTRTLNVTVADRRTWKPSQPPAHHSRGIALINALCDSPEVTATPAGTTVSLQWRLFA
jgi:serine/threonine-protein kinase RsbW